MALYVDAVVVTRI